jgi:hypothetical protein
LTNSLVSIITTVQGVTKDDKRVEIGESREKLMKSMRCGVKRGGITRVDALR